MRQSTLLRFFVISLLAALGLGVASFFALRELNESSISEERRNMIFFVAQTVENGGPYPEAVHALHAKPGRRFFGTNLWVFSAQGDLLARSDETDPPVQWSELKKPQGVHDYVFHYSFLHLFPDLALIKLEANPEAYLLFEFRRPGSLRGPAWIQIAFAFFVLGMSILIAVVITSIYLRNKSKEARAVLSRLEKGDLNARFEIKRTDEIGILMVDFNRMASEIERLVHRVQETETARKNLLEELSHDLRTPLTSLNTSAETLYDHWDEMPRAEQKDFVSVIRTELGYFLHLIEDLFFIAAIGEPRYKKTTRKIDLFELLSGEAKNRNGIRSPLKGDPIVWQVHGEERLKSQAFIAGDPLLIQRLFRNALDNAAKYAVSQVNISIALQDSFLAVTIVDDGKGISDSAIAAFGLPRKNRFQVGEVDRDVSLGLGSVIIKTILELHGGKFAIRRRTPNEGQGTELSLLLPKDPA